MDVVVAADSEAAGVLLVACGIVGGWRVGVAEVVAVVVEDMTGQTIRGVYYRDMSKAGLERSQR
jgi:hypothetical protein